MALLYETAVRRKTVRAKSVNRQLVEEFPFWRVVEVYKVGSIYLTPDQLTTQIQQAVNNAAQQKGLKVLSFRVIDRWSEWKVFYTEYFCRYEAIFGEATVSLTSAKSFVIPIATIIICLAVVIGLLIILYIFLVAREALEGLFNLLPPELRQAFATLLLLGLGTLILGGGVYLLSRAIPKKKV